jgi:hypothetical protein
MRNPVNRLATAAPRAFDSILNPSKTSGTSPSTEKNVDKGTTTSSTIKEQQRNRGASFHLDLSLLLNINDDNAASSSSVGEETGSVLTFEEMMIMQGSSTSSWDELNSDKVAHTN